MCNKCNAQFNCQGLNSFKRLSILLSIINCEVKVYVTLTLLMQREINRTGTASLMQQNK